MEMENNWIKAENGILKEDFIRIEGVLMKMSEELLMTKTQLNLAECRRIEQVNAVEESNRILTDQLVQARLVI